MEKYVNIGSHPLSKRKERRMRKREKEKGDPFARARDCKIQEGTTTPFALLFQQRVSIEIVIFLTITRIFFLYSLLSNIHRMTLILI